MYENTGSNDTMSGRICAFLPRKAPFSFCLAAEFYSPRSASVMGSVAENPANRVKFPATRRSANSCVVHDDDSHIDNSVSLR